MISTYNGEKDQQKFKILALHGYRQNGELFRQKTGAFRKMVHKYAQFTYITAPHKVTSVERAENIDQADLQGNVQSDEFGWFFNRDDRTFCGMRKGGPAIGFEESVRLIEETFEEYGPFDGLLGFSQGACMVGLLCYLQQKKLLKCKFHFAIIASGFKSASLPHLKYYEELISIPAMHIYGKEDEVIPPEMSEALSTAFDYEPYVVNHDGGHYVPADKLVKIMYQDFFKCCMVQKHQQDHSKQ